MYVYRRLIMITIIATIQGNEWQSWFYVLSYYFNSIFCSNENLAKLFTMEEYVDKSISKVSICHFSSLSTAHKNAIRGIRKIKYFVARRKFQQVSSHDPIDCCVWDNKWLLYEGEKALWRAGCHWTILSGSFEYDGQNQGIDYFFFNISIELNLL